MAYADWPYNRIPYFSNPGVISDGVPLGIDPSFPQPCHNALVFNETRSGIAQYRNATNGEINLTQLGFDCGEPVTVFVADHQARFATSLSVTLTTTAGDSETVTLHPSQPGSPVFVGSIPTAYRFSTLDNNGVIDVPANGTLTARYTDPTSGNVQRTTTASLTACTPVLELTGLVYEDPIGSGNCNGNGSPDPGEWGGRVRVKVSNKGAGPARDLVVTGEVLGGAVRFLRDTSPLADLQPGTSVVLPDPLFTEVLGSQPCSGEITMRLTATTGNGVTGSVVESELMGPGGIWEHYSFNAITGGDASRLIPYGPTNWASFTFSIPSSDLPVRDVRVTIPGTSCSTGAPDGRAGISNRDADDIRMRLTAPGGTTSLLLDAAYEGDWHPSPTEICNLVLSDQAASPIAEAKLEEVDPLGVDVVTGHFRPFEPLHVFLGVDPKGLWELEVQRVPGDFPDPWPEDSQWRAAAVSIEYALCDPVNVSPDQDGDGRPDTCETTDPALLSAPGSQSTNRLLVDSDLDGAADGTEDKSACMGFDLAGSNPRLRDSDGDGWMDGLEHRFPGIFPNGPLVADTGLADSDADGLPDSLDLGLGNDFDGDGFLDSYERAVGSSMIQASSRPRLGDVTGDLVTDVSDVLALANASAGLAPLAVPGRADLNGDAVVDVRDVLAAANFVAALGKLPAW
jgi:hypothetical protein